MNRLVLCATSMILAAALFLSCSTPNGSSATEDVTLKSTAETLLKSTDWTVEIEAHVLETEFPEVPGLEKSVKIQPEAIIASSRAIESSVYPRVRGFASLDVSALSSAALGTLTEFCGALVEGSDAGRFMKSGRTYVLVLFRMDLEDALGRTVFDGESKPFSDFLLGEPFVTEAFAQCPVRFFYERGTNLSLEREGLDVFVYLEHDGSKWSVSQLELSGE